MATARTRVGDVDLNEHTMSDLLNGEYGMDEVLREEAGKVLAAAREFAPVSTGAYLESLDLVEYMTDRMVVAVVSTSDHAFEVERDHGVLTRALGASSGKRGKVGWKRAKK